MAVFIIDHNTPQYEQMVSLRYQLLRKPLGLKFSTAELEKEKEDILIGCFDDGRIVGCCILSNIGNKTVRLRQMAVIAGLQGKGIGKVLIQFAENIARDRGFKKIMMHARKSAIGFYEKMGYAIIGSEFEEVNLPHFVMEKSL
jgi:N-acetylglutamate synthase-like GNAT family acetyltransferase